MPEEQWMALHSSFKHSDAKWNLLMDSSMLLNNCSLPHKLCPPFNLKDFLWFFLKRAELCEGVDSWGGQFHSECRLRLSPADQYVFPSIGGPQMASVNQSGLVNKNDWPRCVYLHLMILITIPQAHTHTHTLGLSFTKCRSDSPPSSIHPSFSLSPLSEEHVSMSLLSSFYSSSRPADVQHFQGEAESSPRSVLSPMNEWKIFPLTSSGTLEVLQSITWQN